MKSVTEDIKNNSFSRVYLFYGEEMYLKQQYKNKLKNAVLPEGDRINLSIYSGKGIDVKEVISQAETMPFFARHRLILIEESGFFKNASPQMAEYIPSIPEGTVILFVEEEVDKRGKLFKAVKACGKVVEFASQNEKTLTKWILGLLRQENKQITQSAMTLFLEKTGTDMERIRQELEKLVCYCMDKDGIEIQDVRAICAGQTENKIFDMINALAEKKQKKALELYYDLLSLKEPPMRILYLISRQFNLLMQVKEMQKEGYDGKTIGERLKLAGFIVRNYIRQAGSFSLEYLKEAVNDCVEAEEAVKTGRMNDTMSVELILVKYSSEQESVSYGHTG